MKATTYHYRDLNGKLVQAGSLGPEWSLDDGAKIATRGLGFMMMPSGGLRYEHKGKPVSVYLYLDPNTTDEGKQFLRDHRREQERLKRLHTQKVEEVMLLADELIPLFEKIGSDRALQLLRDAAEGR